MIFTLFNEDLENILKQSLIPLQRLNNAHLFLTGASGFLGIWLIESLLYANEELKLNLTIYGLTRNITKFYQKYPHLKNQSSLKIVEGTVLDFQDNFHCVDYIIHGANLPEFNHVEWPTMHIQYGVQGTQNILKIAQKFHAKGILVMSSGAVYRNVYNSTSTKIEEKHITLNTSELSIYSETKRIIEQLSSNFYSSAGIPIAIARCFALAGAYLPLNQFALGNFIQNALDSQNIIIKGNGLSSRSYMYASDLVVWILHLLVMNSSAEAYNVGSEHGITIKELAELIASMYNLSVRVEGDADTGLAPPQYVPDTQKICDTFGLSISVPLRLTISKMYNWYNI